MRVSRDTPVCRSGGTHEHLSDESRDFLPIFNVARWLLSGEHSRSVA